ncbi:MAG: hypothetical protein HY271_17855 [Deltaproteobacteria bacterium]|nr:hypothetical protein [Deltaproteobacteria bacterium]
MIRIDITPVGVERVAFAPASELEEDLDFAAYQAIRSLLDKIDRRLRRAAHAATGGHPERSRGRLHHR